MACAVHPADGSPGRDDKARRPPAMTRCECMDLSFEEIARSVRPDGLSLEEVTRRTGCGGNCTACLPDLKRYLDSL